jgi:hypothetical protein
MIQHRATARWARGALGSRAIANCSRKALLASPAVIGSTKRQGETTFSA